MASRARTGRFTWLAAALALTLGLGHAANAAVVCQKGKKIKLRADACRDTETPLATLGGGDDPSGIWEFTGGTLLGYDEFRPEFLVLNQDGSGRLNLSGGDGPVVSCAPLNYSRDSNGTLVLDDWGFVLGTRVYRFALQGDNLQLVSAVGLTASFERASAVDPDEDCGSLAKGALFTGLPKPHQPSGLVFDGTELWYKEDSYDDRIVPVDPESGSPGAPLALSNGHVHAAQGADFWTHCNCGGSEEAYRMTRGNQIVDEVQTGLELGEEMSVESIAFDASTGVLWLHGWNDANQGRLMKVDASAEPDVLLQAYDLDASVTGMSFGGSSLWALNQDGQTVMRIDPATGQVVGTFLIPDRSANWRGIAAVGGQLFLLGDTGTQGALLSVALPVN